MYEMKDEYLTGIEKIDAEHRRLFEIAEQAYKLSREELLADKFDHIIELLTELKEYTLMHFEHEEAYMEETGYKRRLSQLVQHNEFREKLAEMTEMMGDLEVDRDDEDKMVDNILSFLTDWLVNHILHMDKLIGKDTGES